MGTSRLVLVGQYTPLQPYGKSDWSYGYMLVGHGSEGMSY